MNCVTGPSDDWNEMCRSDPCVWWTTSHTRASCWLLEYFWDFLISQAQKSHHILQQTFSPAKLFVFACTKTQYFRVCPPRVLAALRRHSALPKRSQSPPILWCPMDKTVARTSHIKWSCKTQVVAASWWASRLAEPCPEPSSENPSTSWHPGLSIHRNNMCNPVQQVEILTWTQIPTKSNQIVSPELLATISSVACTKPASWVVYRQGEGHLHNLNVLD